MSAEDADYIKLYCQIPPIVKMDSSLGGLRNCEYVIALDERVGE